MLRHDASRSGRSDEPGPELSAIAWSRDLGSPVDSSPAVVGGRVLVGTIDGTFWAVDQADGAVIWQASLGSPIVSSPCVAGERVVFGSVDGSLYGLDVGSGEVVWTARTGGPVVASPLLAGDLVLCGSTDGRLYALDAQTGAVAWTTVADGEIYAGAAASGDVVVYANDRGTVHCVSLADGAGVWARPYRADGPVVSCPVIHATSVIVSSLAPTSLTPRDSLNIHCIDLATGKRVWGARGRNPWATDKEKGFSVAASPTMAGEQVWFVTMEGYGNWSAALRSLELATGVRGALVRKRSQGRAISVGDSSAAIAGTVLYLTDYTGELFSIDTATARPLGSIALGALTRSSPAISGGAAFVGTNDGRLLCVR
ncbi:MAG TPA: PQQ-binding-like beta-propeller repeat protein [Armatimonadota bacterium]|nr:PQQ-binding-like beta-propeller repeat protein [Armatimonadota bacterium]